MGTLSVYFVNINLNSLNFDEGHPEIIIHAKIMTRHKKIKHQKIFQKYTSKKSRLAAWSPARRQNLCD